MANISFESMFWKSGGKPIEYQGKTLVMVDRFSTQGATRLRLVFEGLNGEWRQGVALRIDGKLNVNGQSIDKGRLVVFWQDTAPQTVDLEVSSKASSVEVRNVWDVGNGVMDSWHNGAAMIVETLENGSRYYCNDGFPDDDFDDIVFRLERIK